MVSLRRIAFALLVLFASPQASVWAQGKAACVQAYEATQVKRSLGAWIAARSAALVCAAPSCPKTLIKDCTQWAQDLQNTIPTILFEVRSDDGGTPSQVIVSFDGAATPIAIGGKARPFDPGEHVAVFKAPGFVDIEQRFVAFEGDRSRRILVEFVRDSVPVLVPKVNEKPVPLAAKISGAVTIFALGGAAVFGWQGLKTRRDLDDSGCKPSCDSGRVAEMKRDFLVADIALGVGVVATVATGYLWWASRQEQTNPTAFVRVGPHGIALTGAF